MNWALALLLKAAFLIAIFGAARIIAWCIMRFVPPGKARDFLMRDDGKFP